MPSNAELPTNPGKRRAGPLGRGPGAVLGMIAEPVYRFAITRRNRAFDAGEGVTRLDRPVVSVGNLSVGGTGKTPMVAKVVGELVRAGKRPCIAMRGYAKARNATGKSDEAEEYERLLPGVPVVAQPDRIAGLWKLFDTGPGKQVDVVVLDDGFQHRRIARDVDIVLIDATAGTLEDRLFPAGWLREPMGSLARAHAVVVTHAERASAADVERICSEAKRVNPRLVVAVCRHVWAGLRSGEGEVLPVTAVAGKRVFVLCAIGNPGAFVDAVGESLARVEAVMALRDHHPYDSRTEGQIVQRAKGLDAVVTTEKDWTKLGRAKADWPCPVYRPVLELAFDRGWEELWGLVSRGVGIGAMSPTLSVGVAGKIGEVGGTARRS